MYTGVTRGAQVTGVAVCSLCLTWISTALRFYVRFGILKFVGREDWLTIAAMIVFTIFCSLCLTDISYGLGAHMVNIPPESLVSGFKIIFVCELLYVVSTTVTKLSIAAYFLRLSGKRYQRLTIYTTVGVVMLFSSMYFFFLLFQCTPISFLWSKFEDGHGHCLNKPALAAVTYAHCAMSAITDWVFGILPIFFVWNMQMNPRTKLSVILVLSLGFFASSATIVRIFYIKRLTDTNDYSWEGINLTKWSMVEPAIAITAMNIATLRPMFKNFFHFASKRLDGSVDDEDSMRPSGSSEMKLRPVYQNDKRKDRRGSTNDYTAEFAEMLGLSTTGVITTISGGGSDPERAQIRKRFTLRKSLLNAAPRNESETELSPIPSASQNTNWNSGIKTTTVIVVDT